jgi:hypothetical protein
VFSRTSSSTVERVNSGQARAGLVQQRLPSHRGTRSKPPSHTGSVTPEPLVSSNDVKNFDYACSVFVANILNKNAWPATPAKNHMVEEAIEEANNLATSEGRPQSQFQQSARKKVNKCPPLAKIIKNS